MFNTMHSKLKSLCLKKINFYPNYHPNTFPSVHAQPQVSSRRATRVRHAASPASTTEFRSPSTGYRMWAERPNEMDAPRLSTDVRETRAIAPNHTHTHTYLSIVVTGDPGAELAWQIPHTITTQTDSRRGMRGGYYILFIYLKHTFRSPYALTRRVHWGPA